MDVLYHWHQPLLPDVHVLGFPMFFHTGYSSKKAAHKNKGPTHAQVIVIVR